MHAQIRYQHTSDGIGNLRTSSFLIAQNLPKFGGVVNLESRKGDVDDESINDVNEAINSTANTIAILFRD